MPERADVTKIMAPSASGQVTTWKQVNADYADTALAVYVPGNNTRAYALVDSLVEGVGLRADAKSSTDSDTIAAVSSTPGALGVVDLASAQAAGDKVKILQLNNTENAGCAAPSAETVEGRTYTAGERLFAYVNTASSPKPASRICSHVSPAAPTRQRSRLPVTARQRPKP